MATQDTQSKSLTFSELKIGAWFIGFPLDGDDSGHGGFRGRHNIFIKMTDEYQTKPFKPGPANAMSLIRGAASIIPKDMRVLEVGP